ncbi:MAG: arylsulfatase [Phycisphaeraceae bacterium]|nr:arylsulfatase [Phycisphaeraceae bacterium]
MRLLLILITVLCTTVLPVVADESKPPSILLVMLDDIGPADLGCYGSEAVKTPRLDAFAKTGMRFTQAYAGCTVCAPTRSVLMTGIHMGRTSVRLNSGGVPLLDSDVTIAEVLRPAGYATGGFGKWGIGDINTEGAPEKQGFDVFHGYYHQIHAHKYWPEYLIRNSKKEPNQPRQYGTAKGYSHYQTVDETKAFIRSAVKDGKPFFCYAPWCPPHGEYVLPGDDPAVALYADKPWSKKAKNIAAMISMTDRHFGELLDLLEELGVADNTIVLFSGDNGGSEHKDVVEALNPSGGLTGHKRSMHEGGIRTPLIVRWPGRIQPGTESDHIVSHHDVLPTLAEAAGVTQSVPPEVTGLSFVAVLDGDDPKKTHEYHYWEWPRYDWKTRRVAETGLMQALRVGDWKILRHHSDKPWQLYYLPDDPAERQDLAKDHPDRVDAMVQLVEKARVPMREQREPAMPKSKRFR